MTANRFRFRAWDIAEKKMIPCCIDERGRPYAVLDERGVTYEEPICDGVNAHVMQSTGLADKNGKEIFEGDITRCEKIVGVWEWTEYGWGWKTSGHTLSGHYLSHHTDEIIGNIYENSNLLVG